MIMRETRAPEWLCSAALVITILGSTMTMASAVWQGSTIYEACIKSADGNDPKMGDCARDELERQDKLLNAEYAVRLKVSDTALKGAIVASQRAWIGYRDSTCRAEGAVYEGGTMEPLTVSDCEARLTAERLEWLKGLTP